MSSCVADASVVASWFLPDENNGEFAHLYKKTQEIEIHVPQTFYFEFCNAMLMAQTHGRLDLKTMSEILDLVWKLPIQIDYIEPLSMPSYYRAVVNSGLANHLTVYDASYLELSVRLGRIPLLTYDKPMLHAAKKLKIKTSL